MTKFGEELIKSLNEVLSFEKGKKMLKVIEIVKKEEKPAAKKPVFRKQMSQPKALISRREKLRRQASRPRLSAKTFVDTFQTGPAAAAKVGQEILNGVEKAIAEKDVSEFTALAALKSSVGFWRAVIAYGSKLAEKRR